MKPKKPLAGPDRSKMSKRANSGGNTKIPDAYNIEQELEKLRADKKPHRRAIAWLQAGRIELSLAKTVPERALRDQMAPGMLVRRWLSERSPDYPTDHLPQGRKNRLVRCAATLAGGQWVAIHQEKVYEALLNNPVTRDGDRLGFLPEEDSCFYKGENLGEWFLEHPDNGPERLLRFAEELLLTVAGLWERAAELIPNFTESEADETEGGVKAPSASDADEKSRVAELRELLLRARIIALNAHDAARMWQVGFARDCNEATAMRQVFLLGRHLARAETVLAYWATRKMLARAGAGRPKSRFWQWIKTDEVFKNMEATEAWKYLDGKEDPDHKGKFMKKPKNAGSHGINDRFTIIRGDGTTLKRLTFLTEFRKIHRHKGGSAKKNH
jgi:hypothetical protein